MKTRILFLGLALLAYAAIGHTQTATISPLGTATKPVIIPINSSVTFMIDPTPWGTCYYGLSYNWTFTGATLVAPSTATSATPTFKFTTAGVFTITVKVTKNGSGCGNGFQTVSSVVQVQNTVPTANAFATSNFGSMISAYSIDALGNISSGPYDYFDPFPSDNTLSSATMAIGRDKNNYMYFLPSKLIAPNNNGLVEVWAWDPITKNAPNKISSLDINGGGDNTSVELYRLGIDPFGTGWILAGDGTKLYLVKFAANGTSSTTLTVVDADVALTGGGQVSDFESGDLCFDGNGNMFVLAGGRNGTYLYTVQSYNSTSASLVPKWTLKDPLNNNFTNLVTGVAFDAGGSVYFSSLDGVYFIDRGTANAFGTGTVKTQKVWDQIGLTDLATDKYPSAALNAPIPLAVTLEYFKGERNTSGTRLSWKMSMKEDLEDFIVQRSVNGKDFSDIGTVNIGASEYNYLDQTTTNSATVYYRLKLSGNGKYSYSKTVMMKMTGEQLTVSTGPNPFSSYLQMNITSDKAEEIFYTLSGVDGRLLKKSAMKLSKGNNSFFITDLDNLQKGFYTLSFTTTAGSKTYKVVKN